MKKALLALVFGSAIFLAACGGGDDQATDTGTTTEQTNTTDENTTNDGETDGTANGTTDDGATNDAAVADGQAVVEKACISCHGQNLEGMGNFPALNNVGSRYSEEEILEIINNGKGGMPPGVVKGEEAEAAAAYLATLK
nr:cytochrome c [Lysinibacillus timonensis]